jgi:hypothetical protein
MLSVACPLTLGRSLLDGSTRGTKARMKHGDSLNSKVANPSRSSLKKGGCDVVRTELVPFECLALRYFENSQSSYLAS